jgi:hypothetical protein
MFRNNDPGFDDFVIEAPVDPRIDNVRTTSEDSDDAFSLRVQRTTMRGAIDAQREPTDDRDARRRKPAPELLRDLDAVRRGTPAADYRNAWRGE